jgi:hypothetical protein
MSLSHKHEHASAKKLVARYNMISNLLWSVLNLVPIAVFCYRHIRLGLLYAYLAISLFTIFLAISFFDTIH